MQHETGFEGF